MKDINPKQLAVIVAIILIAAILFWQRIEVTDEVVNAKGPSYVAVNNKALFAVFDGSIFQFDLQGRIVNRTKLDVLDKDVFVMDMLATDSHLYLADRSNSQIYECDFNLTECIHRLPDNNSVDTPFKFFVDDENNLWLSEGPRNRLLFAKAGSHQLKEVKLSGKGLFHANRVIVRGDQVAIADTDHYRTVIYRMGEDDPLNLTEDVVLQAKKHPGSVNGNIYPSDIAWCNGKWWVLTGKELHKDAAVFSYSEDGKPLFSLASLPSGADVNAVAAGGNSLYLADTNDFSILKVDPDDGVSTSFGDNEFKKLMAQGRAMRVHLKQQANTYLVSMIAVMIVGFGFAIWFERGKLKKEGLAGAFSGLSKDNKAESKVVADKSDSQIQWFIPDQTRMKNLNRLSYLSVGMSALMLLWWVWVLFSFSGKNTLSNMLPMTLLLLLIVITTIGMSFLSMRIFKYRLGFKGKTLFFRDHTMRVREAPVEEVVYSKRSVSYQNMSIVLIDSKGRPFYSDKTLKFIFEGLLMPAKKLNEWQMAVYQLKFRQPATVASMVFIVIGTVLLVGVKLSKF